MLILWITHLRSLSSTAISWFFSICCVESVKASMHSVVFCCRMCMPYTMFILQICTPLCECITPDLYWLCAHYMFIIYSKKLMGNLCQTFALRMQISYYTSQLFLSTVFWWQSCLLWHTLCMHSILRMFLVVTRNVVYSPCCFVFKVFIMF